MNVCDEASKSDVYEIEVVCRKNGILVLTERVAINATNSDKPLRIALKAARKVQKFKRKINTSELIESAKQF